MADILISKFTTQIPRVGATPATPGFAESEGQDPVAPSGSPIQYGIGAGLSLDSLNQIQLGNDGAGVVDITDENVFVDGFYAFYDNDTDSSELFFNKNSSGSSVSDSINNLSASYRVDVNQNNEAGFYLLAYNSGRSNGLNSIVSEQESTIRIESSRLDDRYVGINIQNQDRDDVFNSQFIGISARRSFDSAGAYINIASNLNNSSVSLAGSASSGGLCIVTLGDNVETDRLSIIVSSSTGASSIRMSPRALLVTDSINSKGLEYPADYSANWTDHSLVTKSWVLGQVSGSAHNPVTIGSPANGLSISGTQVLTIGLASTSATGALSSTDWNTFNNKLNLTSPITGYTVGANTALAATDTILQAFGKVQGQINARISGTIASGQVAHGGISGITGTNNFFYDAVNGRMTLRESADPPLATLHLEKPAGATLRITTLVGGGGGNSSILIGNQDGAGTNTPFIIRSLNASLRFGIGNSWSAELGGTFTEFWRFTSTGVFQANAAQTIQTLTGNLTIATAGDNGNILLTPNGTGLVMIGSGTPTNTLDVNGTARIRTISNLGTAATSVLVPSATGVLRLRTLAELASDGSFLSETTQTVATSGAINDLTSTATTIVFTGTTVTLSGIVAIGTGLERTLINRTGSVLTLLNDSTLSTAANRFLGGAFVANNTSITLKYNSNAARWLIISGPFYSQSNAFGFRSDNPISINRVSFDNVGLTIQSIAGTSYSILTYNNSSAITFEVQNSTAAFPNVSLGVRRQAVGNVALVAQSPASNQFAFGLYTSAGANGTFVNNSMEWTSIGGAGFGVTAGGSPTARVDIRGRGTTTGQTLLLEDSAGTDNASFLDNGQIRFLRLPTSSAGLAAGSLWNNGGVLNIV